MRTPAAAPSTARTITTRVVRRPRRRRRSIFRWRAWRSCRAWSLRSALEGGPLAAGTEPSLFGLGAVRVVRFGFAMGRIHPTIRARELSRRRLLDSRRRRAGVDERDRL